MKILIYSRAESIGEAVRKMCLSQDHEVDYAPDLDEAISKAQDHYDLIFADHSLTEGIEAIQRLRESMPAPFFLLHLLDFEETNIKEKYNLTGLINKANNFKKGILDVLEQYSH